MEGIIIILIDILFQFHCDLPTLHHLSIHQTRIIDNRCFEIKSFLNAMNRSEMLRYRDIFYLTVYLFKPYRNTRK